MVINATKRAPLYMVATIRLAAQLLLLNLSVSRNEPPAQHLPSEARVALEAVLEHMLLQGDVMVGLDDVSLEDNLLV